MSEAVDIFRAMKDHNKRLRAKYGVNCPRCAEVRPKAPPSILLPQQRCRVDGYVDPRPELTNADYEAV
jgi:hypothetical protein